jgi:hypothetical protein
MLANTLFCCEQDVGRQEALEKAYRTQVLFTLDKLNPEITRRLFTELAPVSETSTDSPGASVVLTDGHVLLDLIDHILTANKQSLSLVDKRAKAIRGDQNWKIQDACLLYKGRLVVLEDDNLCTKLLRFIYATLDTIHLGKTKTFQLIAPRYY